MKALLDMSLGFGNVLVCVVLTLSSAQALTPCFITSSFQGEWSLYTTQNGENFEHAYDNIYLESNKMTGFKLEAFPSLTFECYLINGNYITFRSEATKIFDEYDVRIFMCWYMFRVDQQRYNVIELTDPVVVGSDDHAKAYLGDDTQPATNFLCEKSYSSWMAWNPPFKQIRTSRLSWS